MFRYIIKVCRRSLNLADLIHVNTDRISRGLECNLSRRGDFRGFAASDQNNKGSAGCSHCNLQAWGAVQRCGKCYVRDVFLLWRSNLEAYFCPSEPIAKANGCSVVRQYTGHGCNQLVQSLPCYRTTRLTLMQFHTTPTIPHYAKSKAAGAMRAGMVSSSSYVVYSCRLIDLQ